MEVDDVPRRTECRRRFAGHTDWRLPNREELESLTNTGAVTVPATFPASTRLRPGLHRAHLSCTRPDWYWSSSTFRIRPQLGWLVDFDTEGTLKTNKVGNYHVRAVRGGA